MRRLRLILFMGAVLSASIICRAQETTQYPFIKYEANTLHYDTASASMKLLFQKWENTLRTKTGNINIVHIGSSHVQAGMLSNTIRCDLMMENPDLVGPRGMIFPYSAAARCNNPPDYKVHCKEKMILTRNVYKEHTYPLGVCGIAVTATNEPTEIGIVMNEPRVDYATTNVLLIGHSDDGIVPRLKVQDKEIYPSYTDGTTDRYLFNIGFPVDSFKIVLPCREGESFTVTGIFLDNRKPGFTFHSIGVNGAAVHDYLRCKYVVRDMRILRPDLVIFGIGINDAVPAKFDTAAFRQNYLRLVDSVRSINPDCAFIFITNNDSFRKIGRRRYTVNPNGLLAREVFYRLAEETGGAVWDQFELMGGLNSMDTWRRAGLAQTDRIHFTNSGYKLLGHLFYKALSNEINRNCKR